METPLLQLTGIGRRFPGVTALEGVDFSLQAGEVHALLGENGAGKSTLIKILAGAVSRDAGEMVLAGRRVDFRSPADGLAAGIAVIYQELVLCPHLTTVENVLMGHFPRTAWGAVDWRAAERQVTAVVAQLGVTAGEGRRDRVALPLDVPVSRLSTAQQQLVEIAKALSRDSRLIVFDEPSAVLGQQDLERLFEVIRRLRQRGVGIIYISHRLEEIFAIADRVTVLKDGRLVGSWPVAQVTMRSLVQAMTGRELSAGQATPATAEATVLLDVRDFSRRNYFAGVSLQVRAGEVAGIAGLVGSGRTELLRAIYGADQPDGGRLLIAGRAVRIRTPRQALRLGLGFLPEDRKNQGLLLNRALRENVSLANLRRFSRFGILNLGQEGTAIRDLIGRLRIATRGVRQPVLTLSGGNQQKVVLARWLARRCRVLLVDEPTRGVDVGAKEEIHRLLRSSAAEGAAVLVVSSELTELFALCSRILVMRGGRLVGEFSGARLNEASVVDAMLLGGVGDGPLAAG